MKKSRHVSSWCFRNFVIFARRVESCAIFGKLVYRCLFVPCRVLHLTKWSGKKHEQVACAIFSRTQPMLAPMFMGARSLTQRVARQSIRLVDRCVSPLTSGRFVCTMCIQPTLRGKNFLP